MVLPGCDIVRGMVHSGVVLLARGVVFPGGDIVRMVYSGVVLLARGWYSQENGILRGSTTSRQYFQGWHSQQDGTSKWLILQTDWYSQVTSVCYPMGVVHQGNGTPRGWYTKGMVHQGEWYTKGMVHQGDGTPRGVVHQGDGTPRG